MQFMQRKTFAAIDVGSFETTMKIFELAGKNNIRQIDCVGKRIDLGSDTYAEGKISPEKMDELCKTLREFSQIMKTYKVTEYKAYGTSAIRETENTLIVLDQIEIRTGIRLDVLSNSEQRFLDYKSVASKGEGFRRFIEEKTAFVDIGGGSMQISLFENDTLVTTQNVRLGVLRMQEMLNHFASSMKHVETMVDDMVSAQLVTFEKMYLKDSKIRNLIIVDDYLSPWVVKTAGRSEETVITGLQQYEELLTMLRTTSVTQAAQALDVPEEKVPLLYISAIILRQIAQMMGAEKIWAPGVTLCDGIAYEFAEQNKFLTGEHDFEKDIIACALNISKRYMGGKKHAETIERISLSIFASFKKIHGLGKRERLYLRLAALLHACGKYISMVNVGENSYSIIMATEMIGLSHKEREIVANIVRFNHSPFLYYSQLADKKENIGSQAYLIVAKLTAILRVADSLDYSHKQKIKDVKAVLKEEELVLTVDTTSDITLEKGVLEEQAKFFREVYNLTPVVKQKKQF